MSNNQSTESTAPASLNIDSDDAHQEDVIALDVHDPLDEPVMSDADIALEAPLDHSSTSPKTEPNTRSDKTGPAPVPALIKWGLPALILGILVAGIAISFYLSKNNVDPASSFNGGDFEIGGAPIESGVHAPATGTPAVFSRDEQLSSIESNIDSLRLLIAPLQKNNTELQNRIDTMADAITDSEQQMVELRSMLMDVSNTIPALISTDKQHVATLNELHIQTKNNKQRIDHATKRNAESPPFALLSIDEWGSTISAVLEMGGKSTMASVGDIRAGWKITKIIRPDCIYAVRLTDTKPIKVCGAGVL